MKNNVLSLIFLFFYFISASQNNVLTIDNVINKVLKNSNKVKEIDNNYLITKNQFRLYKISFLPKISSSVSLPYQRSISDVTQFDGSQRYIERNFVNSSLNLSISQVLPFTGGTININSSINNNRDFNNNITNFSSNWANINYQQTLNGYNNYKWENKIQDLYRKKDSIDYTLDKIKLKYDVSKNYLETYLLQLKKDLLQKNISKTKSILLELEMKLKIGRSLKIDVEQTKIILEQLYNQENINEIEYNIAIQSLKNFMNVEDKNYYELVAIDYEDFEIEKNTLIEAIHKNALDIEKEIKLLEIDSNIEKVKKEEAITFSIQFGMGLNSTSNNFAQLYESPAQSQNFTISSKIPIIGWGKARLKKDIAKIEKENILLAIEDKEKEVEIQVDEIIKYKNNVLFQIKSLEKQLLLYNNVIMMYEELLKLGRKTITEYYDQIAEQFKLKIEYQKKVNDFYLLKLKINEYNLTLY